MSPLKPVLLFLWCFVCCFSFTIKTSAQLPFQRSNAVNGEVCHVNSGQTIFFPDSIAIWNYGTTLLSDGNLLLVGKGFDNKVSPVRYSNLCMKTDLEGNVIWAKLYDSVAPKELDHAIYFKSIELKNGNILIAGRSWYKLTGNEDLTLTLLDPEGNMIWMKTYLSRFWTYGNGSMDAFALQTLAEDPKTGDVYFAGSHWHGHNTLTKINVNDGSIAWSRAYDPYQYLNFMGADLFGAVINDDHLLIFQSVPITYFNFSIITTAISKETGDTLYTKSLGQVKVTDFDPSMVYPLQAIKKDNGNYLLTGIAGQSDEYPQFTGTKDLYHALVIELDNNLDFIQSYGFKSRLYNRSGNTNIKVFPDGSGIFAMSGEGASLNNIRMVLFKDGKIYHQRTGDVKDLPAFQFNNAVQLEDGGFLIARTTTESDESQWMDYYVAHPSDTASDCIGQPDNSISTFELNFEPQYNPIRELHNDVFSLKRTKTHQSWKYPFRKGHKCEIISHCDTLSITAEKQRVCPGSTVRLHIHKNIGCGSLVPLEFDRTLVGTPTRINDTTYDFTFNKAGVFSIKGSLLGCELFEDSIMIEVFPLINALDLGPDTVLCPGNRISLNARKGFISYLWQDGSTDSTFIISQPGKYFVTAINACGTIFSDTVYVRDHPEIPLDIGPDRVKCNQDTVQLKAPAGFISYTWGNAYNLSVNGLQDVIVNPLVDTVYFLAAEKSPGCFAFDTVRITVSNSAPINLGNDLSICMNDSVQLDAGDNFASYNWNTGEISSSIIAKTKGAYSVIATAFNGCKSYDTLNIQETYSLPIIRMNKPSELCEGEIKSVDAGNFSNYSWNTGATTRTIKVDRIGLYRVTVEDNHGCISSDSFFIQRINRLPSNFLTRDTSMCSYDKVELKALRPFASYAWNNGGNASSIKVDRPGEYSLQVTDINGCVATETASVSMKECMSGFFAPNAFTPNNDGKNDDFKPLLFGEILKYQLMIYNRYGQIIFRTNERMQGWDGTINGRPVSSGTYVWTCVYQFAGQDQKAQRGVVNVVR